jgi:multidrug resistance efflux pump
MIRIFDIAKDKLNIPTLIVVIAIFAGLFHLFSYLLPFTDDAFVTTNSQVVAADTAGFIEEIYVQNGEAVKKGSPLFRVYDVPYKLAYQKAQADFLAAEANIEVIQQQTAKNKVLYSAMTQQLAKLQYQYTLKSDPSVNRSIAQLDLQNLAFDVKTQNDQVRALNKQIEIDDKQLKQQEQIVVAAKAALDIAKINLDLTIVRAGSDGIVDNMYLSVGTPVVQHQPLFSFINTNAWYVQANFNETDLRNVRPGDKVTFILRMYYFNKIFMGWWLISYGLVIDKLQYKGLNSRLFRMKMNGSNSHNGFLYKLKFLILSRNFLLIQERVHLSISIPIKLSCKC